MVRCIALSELVGSVDIMTKQRAGNPRKGGLIT